MTDSQQAVLQNAQSVRQWPAVKATTLNKCPVAGCRERPEPLMCEKHWPLVSGPTRRALVQLWKSMSGKGVKDAPGRLLALLTEAVRETSRAEAKVA